MLDLQVLNSLILLGDVLQEPMTAYTDCCLLNRIDGIDLPVRLYSNKERIATAEGSTPRIGVGAFTKETGIFVDEKLAELPTIASLRFGRLTVEVLGVAGSLAMLYQEFKDRIPALLRQYIQMFDPLEVYKVYEAVTTEERDSYDNYIKACFEWSPQGTYAGDSVVAEGGSGSTDDVPTADSRENTEADVEEDEGLHWFNEADTPGDGLEF